MHRILCGIAALAMIVAAASGASTPASKKKGSVARSPVVRKKPMTALQKSVLQKRAVTSPSSSRKKAAPAKPAVNWRNRQLQPSQDRYKEIQEALASKGYLPPDQATGAWDQNSTGALKQFQTAQNLDASGKINALSLIALGLGPKHEAAPAPVPQPADQSR
jgi:Putative peptidoglycan binding domain